MNDNQTITFDEDNKSIDELYTDAISSPNIKTLNIKCKYDVINFSTADVNLKLILKNCKHIENLDIYCGQIDDSTFDTDNLVYPTLKTLKIDWDIRTKQQLQNILFSFPNLDNLNIGEVDVKNSDMVDVIIDLPTIKNLYFRIDDYDFDEACVQLSRLLSMRRDLIVKTRADWMSIWQYLESSEKQYKNLVIDFYDSGF